MSVRSGVFTKYVIEFPGLELKVSNDASAGDLQLNADITVTMARNVSGTTFSIVIYDLPQSKVDLLRKAKAKTSPLAQKIVNIQLGYFETGVSLVMEGVFEQVSTAAGAANSAGPDKLAVTIKGDESALYACAITPYAAAVPAEGSTYATVAQALVTSIVTGKNATDNPGIAALIDKTVTSDATTALGKSETSFSNGKVLTALGEVAKRAKQELVIVDKKVVLGKQIAAEALHLNVAPAVLDFAVNLTKFEEIDISLKGKASGGEKPAEVDVKCFNFTCLGDPSLRPGLGVSVPDQKSLASTTFVIRTVEHQFNSSTGYICVGTAASVVPDGSFDSTLDGEIKSNAESAAKDLVSAIKAESGKSPVIEVVSVKAPQPSYRADLYYGQPGEKDQQPSITLDIKQPQTQVYQNKPILSSFAWMNCGLVTPVYRGMKAVLAHNFGLSTDGIVAGYIWSEQPDIPPPANQLGDWWLSLPIDLDDDSENNSKKPPSETTKGVNDLTGADGKRVIEVKGLKITVGAGKLAKLGARPTEGPDDDFLIEHASGTTFHIDSNGALTIDASKASISIKGDVVIEGTLEIK